MQLRNHNSLSAIDDESTSFGHIGNSTEVDVLNDGIKILMLRVGAIEFQLSLQGNAECQSAFNTFFNCVAWGVDIIIEEFENKIISCVGNGKIFRKDLK